MADKPKFNASRPRPKLTAAAVRRIRKGKGGGKKSNAWRKYVGGGTVSNEPIPW
jgi:hypothetical protein